MSSKLLAPPGNTKCVSHSLWLATAIFLVALLLAWTLRFIQDDAFISFRYVENLAMGLVWNPGERIEGYTNFLWTLLMSIPMQAGWDPVQFAFLGGITFFAVTLALTYRLGILLFGDTLIALTAIGLLVRTLLRHRRPRTPMQTCAIVTAAFLLVKEHGSQRLFCFAG